MPEKIKLPRILLDWTSRTVSFRSLYSFLGKSTSEAKDDHVERSSALSLCRSLMVSKLKTYL